MNSIIEQSSRRTFLKGAVMGAGFLCLGDYRALAGTVGGESLLRATPESVGVDPGGVLKFIEAVEQKVGGLHSFMLLRDGKVAAEGWWAPYTPEYPHSLFSLSKSFCSTAMGIAVQERYLTLDTRLVSLYPREVPVKLDDNFKAMKVRHLLSMSTGHDKDATGAMAGATDGDWVKAFLSLPVEHAPGSKFVYNSAATYMVSAIMRRVTGMDVLEYLTPRLFEPLGIKTPTWEKCPKGISVGGWGLSLRTEDIAKFGQLYLQKGQWNGRQLLPEAWVAEATSKQVSNGDPTTGGDWNQGYGFQFWRCRHGHYRGDGAFGQYCIVMPEHKAVLAITSGVKDMAAVMDAAWENLLPAMTTESKPNGGSAALSTKTAALSMKAPQGSPGLAMEKIVSGKNYLFDKNDQKIESIRFGFRKGRCRVTIKNVYGEQDVDCGAGIWDRGKAVLDIQPPAFVRVPPSRQIAAAGAWTGEDTYTMKVCMVETPFIQTMICRFLSDSVELKTSVNVGFGPTEWKPILGKALTPEKKKAS